MKLSIRRPTRHGNNEARVGRFVKVYELVDPSRFKKERKQFIFSQLHTSRPRTSKMTLNDSS